MTANNTQVMLGSGEFYVSKVNDTSTAFNLISLVNASNSIGKIQGGATLNYSINVKEVMDDSRAVYRKFITGDSATLKTGLLTFDVQALNGLYDGTYSSTTTANTLKLGGKTRKAAIYDIAFVHTLESGETITVGMRATNDGGLEMAFANENETVIDLEFNAISMDANGNVVIIEETKPTVTP